MIYFLRAINSTQKKIENQKLWLTEKETICASGDLFRCSFVALTTKKKHSRKKVIRKETFVRPCSIRFDSDEKKRIRRKKVPIIERNRINYNIKSTFSLCASTIEVSFKSTDTFRKIVLLMTVLKFRIGVNYKRHCNVTLKAYFKTKDLQTLTSAPLVVFP